MWHGCARDWHLGKNLQVQFLSMTGKVGGSQGSDALRNFSSGFEWANYRLGLTNGADGEKPRGSASRRQKKGAKVAGKDSAGNETGTEPSEMDCSWEVGAPVVEVWGTCIVCLLAVSISRSLLVFILEHVLKKKTSPALLFPAWEVCIPHVPCNELCMPCNVPCLAINKRVLSRPETRAKESYRQLRSTY